MNEDMLEMMMRMQLELQRESYGVDITSLPLEDRIEMIKINILAATDELHEALNETGWKPWATSRHINEDAFRSELIDAWHFMMNLFHLAGMTPYDVVTGYRYKRKVNEDRQRDGYDGVSSKCATCKRALDDPSVECTEDQCAVVPHEHKGVKRVSQTHVLCSCGEKFFLKSYVEASYMATFMTDSIPSNFGKLLAAKGLKNIKINVTENRGKVKKCEVWCDYNVRGNYSSDIKCKISDLLPPGVVVFVATVARHSFDSEV